MASSYNFTTLKVNAVGEVLHVQLSRPAKRNAMNTKFFEEIATCFSTISQDKSVRAVVLSGEGKIFSAGLDLSDNPGIGAASTEDVARLGLKNYDTIIKWQDAFSLLETIPQPVIAAVHGACVGGGIDLVTCADIRLCSADAFFSIKEIDIGMCADLGTLQRLPKLIGNQSLVRELAYTGRDLPAAEALSCGFVSSVLPNRETLIAAALQLASCIADRSPVAITACKRSLLYTRDHSVHDGLRWIAAYNMSQLQTGDMMIAMQARMQREKPIFAKL